MGGSPGQASFVFLGEVTRANSSNVAAVEPSHETAIVAVQEVLRAPEMLQYYAGVEVTIHLAPDQRAAQGQHAVFFTEPWVFAEHLAVEVVGMLDATKADEARKQAREEISGAADRAARQRAEGADLVIEGQVGGVSSADYKGPVAISEHDPMWWIATVAVEAVERGQSADQIIEVAFANSRDIAWHLAPKLREGDRGRFLLRREKLDALDREIYTVTDPLDVQLRQQGEQQQGEQKQ